LFILQTRENCFIYSFLHHLGTAENPEVFPFWMSHNSIFIVFAQVNYPVVTSKRPEERNSELGVCLLVDYPCLTSCRPYFAAKGLVIAFVQDRNFPISFQGIRRPTSYTALLKPVRIPRNLIPCPCVAG
jgi:hypothetical protein